MWYTAAEIILFLVASLAIGVGIGYVSWGRRAQATPTEESETLRRQLVATRKRASAAEAELVAQKEALSEAETRIEELSKPSTPKVDDSPAE